MFHFSVENLKNTEKIKRKKRIKITKEIVYKYKLMEQK